MTRQELSEYRDYILTRYDEYLQATENRGASWGEVYHIQNLKKRELDAMDAELEKELERLENEKL